MPKELIRFASSLLFITSICLCFVIIPFIKDHNRHLCSPIVCGTQAKASTHVTGFHFSPGGQSWDTRHRLQRNSHSQVSLPLLPVVGLTGKSAFPFPLYRAIITPNLSFVAVSCPLPRTQLSLIGTIIVYYRLPQLNSSAMPSLFCPNSRSAESTTSSRLAHFR